MIKKDKKKKFPEVESYKSLCNKGEDENYLDNLSSQILSTLNEMKSSYNQYKKCEEKFFKINQSILNHSFNEIKTLLWTRFCIQIREYSDIIFVLLKIKKIKKNIKKFANI